MIDFMQIRCRMESLSPMSASDSIRHLVMLVLAGNLLLVLSSYLTVPMVPVPMTMQSFAVILLGALYGWRLGSMVVFVWLGEAMLGLPVLANGAGGIAHFYGPTAGYLFAFPLSAALAGWLIHSRGAGGRIIYCSFASLGAGLLCIALGSLYLASQIGLKEALIYGAIPFLPGCILKSALVALTLCGTRPFRRVFPD